jgi:hypothetical protein
MHDSHACTPRPPYRWQLGLLFQGLPRRFIPDLAVRTLALRLDGSQLSQLSPGLPDRKGSKPCGPVESGQLCGSIHHLQVLRLEPENDGFCVLSRTVYHASTL